MVKTMFRKEHYSSVAKAISRLPENPSKNDVIMTFTKMFSEDSAFFIAHRFMDVCEEQ